MPHYKIKVGSLMPSGSSKISQSTSRNTPKRKMFAKVSTISRISYRKRQNKTKSNDEHEDDNVFDHTSNSTITKSAQSLNRPISTTSLKLKHCDSAIQLSKIIRNKDPNEKTNQYTYEAKTESNEKNRTQRRYYKGRICPWCSNCCCLALILGLLLLLAGLAALLVYIFTLNRSTTTTVTTTTTTSATTTTTTSSTSTTTSTSTTSTSSTSTTSRTTTTTTATTPTPPCLPTSVGSSSTLYSASSGSGTAYNCYAYEWTSPTTGLVTLTFQLRHDPGYWYVDDVSVYEDGTQKIINGGFETGSLSPWVVANPFGSCGSFGGRVSSSSPKSGSYSYADGSNGCADQVSQQFSTTLGQVYVVSFWMRSSGTGSGISALVTLS